jgi:hypothetical protein
MIDDRPPERHVASTMTRSTFACTRCTTVLATIRPATVLRVVPGVAVTHNRRFGTLELRCSCGQIERCDVPRRVDVIVVGGLGQAAA